MLVLTDRTVQPDARQSHFHRAVLHSEQTYAFPYIDKPWLTNFWVSVRKLMPRDVRFPDTSRCCRC